MKLAAIDIGSNSFHLIVVEVYPDGHYVVVDKAKDMVGLASRTIADGYLSEEAMGRGVRALKRFARMSKEHGVEATVAVATSAMREAVNADHFIRDVREECGIEIEVISGEEEARLIYLGARENIDWAHDRRALLVDIGGGSVEFILGDKENPEFFASYPLGVRRLSERFLHSDPPKKLELRDLKAHILEALEPLQAELADKDFDFVVGCSGTLNNLAKMSSRRNGEDTSGSHGLWTRLQDLKEMGRALSGLRASERIGYHGVNPKRKDNIVAGAQLIKYILRAVEKDCYVACDYALRDGLVMDFLDKYCEQPRTASNRMRGRSVRKLARRLNHTGAHPDTVKRITLNLFDELEDLHGLNKGRRDLLRHAAIMYDLGSTINKVDRHLHSGYLVRHGVLPGFTEEERELMANIVELRRDPEMRQGASFLALSEQDQKAVAMCAGLLRLGSALDRSRTGNVMKLQASLSQESGAIELRIKVRANTGLETWAVENRGDLLREVAGHPIKLSVSVESR